MAFLVAVVYSKARWIAVLASFLGFRLVADEAQAFLFFVHPVEVLLRHSVTEVLLLVLAALLTGLAVGRPTVWSNDRGVEVQGAFALAAVTTSLHEPI